MRKKGSTALVVLLVLAFVNAGTAGTTKFPRRVAKVALFSQGGGISPTTLFTPGSDGLYRLTIYIAEMVPGNTGGSWSALMQWDDVTGTQTFGADVGCLQVNERLVTEPVRLLKASPLTYAVTDSNASGQYELVITVERLF